MAKVGWYKPTMTDTAAIANTTPTALVRALEERAFNAWPAHQTVFHRGWVFRLSGGYTKRANSVNALVPGINRATAEVSDLTGKGRHTSTSALAIPLPQGGWIVDTPGVRSFGISHVKTSSIVAAFSDLTEFSEQCPRGCHHETSAVGCALDAAVADGRLDASRLSSFRRMERAFN